MAQPTGIHTGYVQVNGTLLYYERRGDGPAVLLVPGGLPDSAHHAAVAAILAEGFTTVTYDRRGNSSSPRPPGWHSTTIGEQADDVAGLVEALGLAPCAVWGSSLGALVLLELLARRPGLVRAAIVHEPPLFTVLDGGERMARQLAVTAAGAVRAGRTARLAEQHSRTALGPAFDRMAPDLRERMLSNAEVFFGLEVPGLLRSLPDATAVSRLLDRVDLPVHLAAGPEDPGSPPYLATRWLADRRGVPLHEIPGGHACYAVEPEATAEAIRELLAEAVPGHDEEEVDR